jgi:hypothetical protein
MAPSVNHPFYSVNRGGYSGCFIGDGMIVGRGLGGNGIHSKENCIDLTTASPFSIRFSMFRTSSQNYRRLAYINCENL